MEVVWIQTLEQEFKLVSDFVKSRKTSRKVVSLSIREPGSVEPLDHVDGVLLDTFDLVGLVTLGLIPCPLTIRHLSREVHAQERTAQLEDGLATTTGGHETERILN